MNEDRIADFGDADNRLITPPESTVISKRLRERKLVIHQRIARHMIAEHRKSAILFFQIEVQKLIENIVFDLIPAEKARVCILADKIIIRRMLDDLQLRFGQRELYAKLVILAVTGTLSVIIFFVLRGLPGITDFRFLRKITRLCTSILALFLKIS